MNSLSFVPIIRAGILAVTLAFAPNLSAAWGAAAPMSVPRTGHTATLLQNGKVLVTGGSQSSFNFDITELYDPVTNIWTVGPIALRRSHHTATLLRNGKVLIAGGELPANYSSSELYDPATNSFISESAIAFGPRARHTATLLPNGKVLVVGGLDGTTRLNTTQLYDPDTNSWTTLASLNLARADHTATLLPDGSVLVVGGSTANFSSVHSIEIFDPTSGTWHQLQPMNWAHGGHTATLLITNGNPRVLIAGGNDYENPLISNCEFVGTFGSGVETGSTQWFHGYCTGTLLPNGLLLVAGGTEDGPSSFSNSGELYNPATGTWSSAGNMAARRVSHTATLLPNGDVLMAGGNNSSGVLSSVEIYHLNANRIWDRENPQSTLATVPHNHTVTTLSDGKLLVVGGWGTSLVVGSQGPTANELYDPATDSWRLAGGLINYTLQTSFTATLLSDGRVLTAGGVQNSTYTNGVEIYNPATDSWSPGPALPAALALHTATLLNSGNLLVVGGYGGGSYQSNVYLYAPSVNMWFPVGSLTTARSNHTATLLSNGDVLIAGGRNSTGPVGSAEVFRASTGTWSPAGTTSTRYSHTATRLLDGKVMVAGGYGPNAVASVDLYDPALNTWTPAAAMNSSRAEHTATLLPSGRVFIAGGIDSAGTFLSMGEYYDPVIGSSPRQLLSPRARHTASLLPNGRVFLIGGTTNGTDVLNSAESIHPADSSLAAVVTARTQNTATVLASGKVLVTGGLAGSTPVSGAETYDPATDRWIAAQSMLSARYGHTASLLPNGNVLVAAGRNSGGRLGSSEIYNPTSNMWTSSGSLLNPRDQHTATLLSNGKVLVVGGVGASGTLSSAELFDTSTGTWSAAASMSTARFGHTATLLPTGRVLVSGTNGAGGASAELYDPTTNTWTSAGNMSASRSLHTATLLTNGKVLVSGGAGSAVDLYDPATNSWSSAASLMAARSQHTATLLPNGRVAVAGGTNGSFVASIEIYDPTLNSWFNGGTLAFARYGHSAALLSNGKVLLVGGTVSPAIAFSENYDPQESLRTSYGNAVRGDHTATLLDSQTVLIAGGQNAAGATASAQIFDCATKAVSASANMTVARHSHTATLIPGGMVLITGGTNSGPLASAEIYNRTAFTFSATAPMSTARTAHTATRLSSGKVLVAGGHGGSNSLASAEAYDPFTGTWAVAGTMSFARSQHTATKLPNGKILVVGGMNSSGTATSSAELYDPVSNTWSLASSIPAACFAHTATLLESGLVLVTGGMSGAAVLSSEYLYNPAANSWSLGANTTVSRAYHTSTLMPDGSVLETGGNNGSSIATVELLNAGVWITLNNLFAARSHHTATLLPDGGVLVYGGNFIGKPEIVYPLSGCVAEWQPSITSVSSPVYSTGSLTLTGERFLGVCETSDGTNSSPVNYPLVRVTSVVSGQSRFLLPDSSVSFSATSFTSAAGFGGLPAGPASVTVIVNGIPSAPHTINIIGAADRLQLSLATSQMNGSPFTGANTLTAKDNWNNIVPNFSGVTVSVTANAPLSGTVSGLGSVNNNVLNQPTDFVNGIADLTATGMTYTGNLGTGTFTASASGLKPGTSGNVTITHGALHHFTLALSAPQRNAVSFTAGCSLTALDVTNNPVLNFNPVSNSVTVTVGSPLSGTLTGLGSANNNVFDQASDFFNGVATLSGKLKYTGIAGSGLLTATSANGKTVTLPPTLQINPGDFDHFEFALASPQTNTVTFSATSTLTARDISNNTVSFSAQATPVTLTVNAPLSGTLTGLGSGGNNVLNQAADFSNGVATLSNKLKYTGVAATGTLTATSSTGKTGTSAGLTVNAGPLDHFAVSIASPQMNTIPFSEASTVTAQDVSNNSITTFNASANNVTITRNSPLTGSLTGLGTGGANVLDRATDFVGGTANLSALGLTYTGSTATGTLTATSAGKTGTSNNVTINPGPLHHFTLTLAGVQRTGLVFTGTNTLTAIDFSNNTIVSFSASANPVYIAENAPLTGTITGLGTTSENLLNRSNDFVNGVANLTALGMTFTGSTATGTFTATSIMDNKTGTSGNVIIALQTQVITFATPADRVYGAPPFSLGATASSGLPVSYVVVSGSATVSGSTLTITGAGTITVQARQTGNLTYGLAVLSRTFTVSPAPLSVTANDESRVFGTANPTFIATYNGFVNGETAANLTGSLSLSTIATTDSNVGSYPIAAAGQSSPNYSITFNSGTLTVTPAAASVTLSDLSKTYTGAAQSATITTVPAGISTSATYNGSATAIDAGSYTVVATITNPNYSGNAAGTLTISKAAATVALANLSAAYDGVPHAATATTSPVGLTVDLRYDGSATAPTAAGNYTVVATVVEANYSGAVSGTLVIAKAPATVTLSNLSAVYDGSAKSVSTTTTPTGLNVSVTYDGSATAPINAGSYNVLAIVSDANHSGGANGTLTIAKSSATVTLSGTDVVYDGTAKPVTAITTPAGLNVAITYDGLSGAPTAAGTYSVFATITNPNYSGSANEVLTIAPAPATIALSGLNVTYNGAAQSAIVTTSPAGLSHSVTYDGSASAPIAAGSYTVVATITDANHAGTVSGTLVIAKANASVLFGNLNTTYDGSTKPVSITTTPAGLNVTATYNGSTTPPVNAGSYSVVAAVNDPNFSGSSTGVLNIAAAYAEIGLSDLFQVYDGSEHAIVVATNPPGLALNVLYDGAFEEPLDAGAYSVLATINDSNYFGTTSGVLTIAKANATVTLTGLSALYNGTPKYATATTTPEGLSVNLTYNGSSSAPIDAGTYVVVGTIDHPNFEGSTAAIMTITVPGGGVNHAPTDIAISALSIYENEPAGTVIGTFSSGDPDAGNSFTYQFVSGPGGEDNALFEIAGNTLKSAAIFDFETQAVFSILIRSTDQDGLSIEEQFTIAVIDVYEFPAPAEIESVTLTANLGDALNYRISVASAAVIATATLEIGALSDFGITFNAATQRLTSPSILRSGMVTIELRDSQGSLQANLLLTIKRSNNPNTPKITSAPIATPDTVQTGAVVAFTVSAEDKDGDSLAYFWDFGDGVNDGHFNRTQNPQHVYTAPGTYNVTVTVSDGVHKPYGKTKVVVISASENTASISTFKLAFDFRNPAKSSLNTSGKLRVASTQPVTDVIVNVNIPGSLYSQDFALDTKGTGGDATRLLTLKVSAPGASANVVKFTLALKDASLFDQLAPLGYENTTTDRAGVPVTLPLSIQIPKGGSTQTINISTLYRAVRFKSGKAVLRK